MRMKEKTMQKSGLAAGVLAVLLWAVVPAVRQILARDIAMFFAGGLISLAGGIVMYAMQRRAGGYLPLRSAKWQYWVLVAGMYLLSSVTSTMTLGLARTEQGMMLSSLLFSLWPLATLLLAVPILKVRIRRGFYFAVALGVLGVALAAGIGDIATLPQTLRENALCILCGLLSPLCWGIASNYYCIYVQDVRADYVALTCIADGIFQLVASFAVGETVGSFTAGSWLGLIFQMLFATVFANQLWNRAMRSEHRLAAVLFSNMLPVVSTLSSCLLLGARLTWPIALGSVLIVAATLLADRFSSDEANRE